MNQDSRYLLEQAGLLQEYAVVIKLANHAKNIHEQQTYYTQACVIAQRLKTLTVKQVYINIEAKLEEIEANVLLPALSPKEVKTNV